jgi:hypothetical protein
MAIIHDIVTKGSMRMLSGETVTKRRMTERRKTGGRKTERRTERRMTEGKK